MDDQEPERKPRKMKIIRLTGKSKALFFFGFGLFILLGLGFFLSVVFFMQIGLFALLGIEYDSWGAVIGFLLLTFVFDMLMSMVLFSVKLVSFRMLGQVSQRASSVLFGLIQIVLDLIAVHVIDEWMPGVTLSNLSEVLLVLIVFAIDKLTPGPGKIRFMYRKK